jgi:pimeloyl-ACP methyl ester carboxylesterase
LSSTDRPRSRREPGREQITGDTAGHRSGSGTPLLLLHGFSATWRAWKPLLPLLEPHHDVIAPTLLGHSGADPVADGIAPSVEALADGVVAELDRLGLDQVHVVGNSLGGWIALELARRGRASSVVALSPGGAWRSAARIAVPLASLRLVLYAATRHAARLERMIESPRWRRVLLSGVVARPEQVAAEDVLADLRSVRAAPALLPLLRSLTATPLRPLPDPGCPIRIVWGRQDRLIPLEHFGRPLLQRVPSAELVELDGAGHVPMWDRPDAVAELILTVTGPVDATAPSAAGQGGDGQGGDGQGGDGPSARSGSPS